MSNGLRRLKQAFIDDWHGKHWLSYGLIVAVITSLAVVLFYLNHPQPDVNNDTGEYLAVTQKILTTGNPIDALRTPGYPSFVALIYLLTGRGNLTAVGIVQGALFVLATLEVYALTLLIFKRSWVALCVGLLMGTSTYLLGFVKPIIVEGLTLWLTVTLALVVVLFIRAMKPAYLWLAAVLLLVLFMTRPEWVYLPVFLFAYLLWMAHRRGLLRKLLPQSVAAVALLYVLLGLFIYANATENGYAGITYVQNINVLGKVLEYHMQGEASAQYEPIMAVANPFVQHGGWDPNQLQLLYPSLAQPQWNLGGAYADSIILHHPVQFVIDTIPLLFTSSKGYSSASPILAQGPFAGPLAFLNAISGDVYRSYEIFLVFAAFWAVLCSVPRTKRQPVVEMMGVLVLLAFYELVTTSVGGYVQFWRLHIPFDPLMTLIIWGSVLASVPFWKPALDRLALPGRAFRLAGLALLVVALVAVALVVYKRGVGGALALVADHPLGIALALLLLGAFTIYAYRRQAAVPGAALEAQMETAKASSTLKQ